MSIRILLADDHSVVRQGLRMFLNLDPDLEVVGEATNGAEAIQLAESLKPDIVLMDLVMPVMSGLEATAEICRRSLPIQVIVLTSVLDDTAVSAVIRAGATGYLIKDTEASELGRSIKAVVAGRVQLSPQIASRLLNETHLPDEPQTLTERENEVLTLAADGFSESEIADRLLISELVVYAYLGDILEKLRLTREAQLALLEFSNQLPKHPDTAARIDYLIQEIRRLLQADACALLVPDAEPGYLVFKAAVGWQADPTLVPSRISLDESCGPGWVMKTSQTWQTKDLSQVNSAASQAVSTWLEQGFRSLALIPILAEGHSLGVLALSSRQSRLLDEDELRFSRLLSNQAGLVVGRPGITGLSD